MERAALPLGTRLGDLEVLRVLADGGFGIVYLARDHALDRDVAIKEFMPVQLAERHHGTQVTVRSGTSAQTFALGLRAFIDEAKLLASFSHPAIVKVYQFWEANGTGYMVMPHLQGPTLSDVRRSMSEPPTEAWMRSMIEPLLDALALLHSRGVCHRDVAPDNVIVTGPGKPVLLDFGAARRLIGHSSRPVTAVVKPCYAPIEQYADAAHLQQGPWTDLYGVAALIAYLVDGKPPPAATQRCVHDEMIPLARRRIEGVSTRFLSAFDWAFAVRPHDRPHSVRALREALDGRRNISVAHWRHSAAWLWRRVVWTLSPAPGSRRRAFPPWVPAGAAVALLVLVGASRMTVDTTFGLAKAAPSTKVPAVVAASSAAALVVAAAPPPPVATLPPSTPEVEEIIEEARPAVTPEVVAAPSARAAARRAPHKTALRRSPEIESVAAGPRELCAERNFFLRPYCMQRLCGDARYKKRAECSPPAARNEHY